MSNPFVSDTVIDAAPDARAAFIRRTYLHVAAALLAFVGLEAALLNSPLAVPLAQFMLGGKFSWLIVLGAFMATSWIADKLARSDAAPGLQYVGLGLYVIAEAVIFVPIMLLAANAFPGVITQAGLITLLLFGGLTATAFMSGSDFSFLRSFLVIGGFVALGAVVAGILFGFSLGIWFSAAMVLFAGGSILYTTGQIIHHYRTEQHVAAALALFSGVMLMLWYVMRVLMSLRR
jgi:FtsH-binding integral membrane protein